jgi:hypothetical protein
MKRHAAAFPIAIATFFCSFYLSPIQFTGVGVGSGALISKYDNFCSFGVYRSTYFQMVSTWSCSFDDEESAAAHYGSSIEEPFMRSVISEGANRHLLMIDGPEGMAYCIFWLEGHKSGQICSFDLDHVIAFEDQFYPE